MASVSMWASGGGAGRARGLLMIVSGAGRSGLEVVLLARRRAEVLDDALFEEILHRLAAVARGDAVVVLVSDDRDVANRRRELDRIEGRSSEERVREDDDVARGGV